MRYIGPSRFVHIITSSTSSDCEDGQDSVPQCKIQTRNCTIPVPRSNKSGNWYCTILVLTLTLNEWKCTIPVITLHAVKVSEIVIIFSKVHIQSQYIHIHIHDSTLFSYKYTLLLKMEIYFGFHILSQVLMFLLVVM